MAAEEAGLSLTGVTIRVGGEPVTAAKLERMRRVGARVMPAYGSIEAGAIGLGCPNPSEIDHMHLASDAMALITHPLQLPGTGMTAHAFNLTSLIDASPKVMLNYQIDDDGVVEERDCGCPLHACGYTTSLHTVRSYSKLLVEGVTLIGAEIQAILEEVLPARFGGSPLDYQLLESEEAGGVTRLHLLVSPRLSIPDAQEVARVFLRAVRASSPRGDAGGSIWEQARTLEVLRQDPVLTPQGKMLPLYNRRPVSRN
jgi:phenylacetate-coenzyme A ligase PaaK-like adenylate-forming protein